MSQDPLNGPVCCSAIPSAEKKGNMLDSIDDDDDIEWSDKPFDYCNDQNTETL
jgi:hypothetical protein